MAAVIRETWEEIGVKIRRDKLRAVHVMHHRNPEGATRVGWFFMASEWDGAGQQRAAQVRGSSLGAPRPAADQHVAVHGRRPGSLPRWRAVLAAWVRGERRVVVTVSGS